MTFENVEHALDLLNEDDLAENPDICESLFSLMSPAERKDAEALYPLLAAHAARFRAGQRMPPPEGVAQQEPADADEEPDEEAPAPQQKSGDNDEPAKKYEEVNGFTLAGEADALNVQEADNAFNEYVIALGKWPFDEFKDKLQALDGRIGGLITKKPILYRQIEYGQPIPGKKGGYNDIYNNFGLWFFDGFNNVTWLQYTRGTLIVYNRDDLPQFFFTTMLVRPATQWLYTFYTKTSGKAVRAGLKTVFNRRLNIANAVDAGQGAGEQAGAADNDLAVKMPEDKKEELIVKELIARMRKELVGKFYLDRNITTLPPPGKKYGHVIVKGAAPRIVDGKFQGFDMNKKHLFTDEDAVKLALSRSNWRYTGRDGATADVFNRIMNVDTINVKALLAKEFDFGVEREEAPDAAVQAAQAAIDAAMKPFRFGIANLVVGEFNRDERLPEDKNVLHVMMPGRDKTVLFNEQAKAFLERFGLYGTVEDALKAAKAGGFGNIELALTRDNKLKKTA